VPADGQAARPGPRRSSTTTQPVSCAGSSSAKPRPATRSTRRRRAAPTAAATGAGRFTRSGLRRRGRHNRWQSLVSRTHGASIKCCGGNRCGAFHTLGIQNETTGSKGNITGTASVASTRYFLGAGGNFARELTKAVNISGLPNLRMFGGSGHYLTLADGSMASRSCHHHCHLCHLCHPCHHRHHCRHCRHCRSCHHCHHCHFCHHRRHRRRHPRTLVHHAHAEDGAFSPGAAWLAGGCVVLCWILLSGV
jgi:hypothetical protein